MSDPITVTPSSLQRACVPRVKVMSDQAARAFSTSGFLRTTWATTGPCPLESVAITSEVPSVVIRIPDDRTVDAGSISNEQFKMASSAQVDAMIRFAMEFKNCTE